MNTKQENYLEAIERFFELISMFDLGETENKRYGSIVEFKAYVSNVSAQQFMYNQGSEWDSDLFRIIYDFADYLIDIEMEFKKNQQIPAK